MRSRKKHVIIIWVLLAAVILQQGYFSLLSMAAGMKTEIDSIWEYYLESEGADGYQEYFDQVVVAGAGAGSEWLVLSMKGYGVNVDYRKYIEAAKAKLAATKHPAPTDYERIGLAFACLDAEEAWIKEVLPQQYNKRGIMSLIYGLILAESRRDYFDDDFCIGIADEIIAKQLSDGGFALTAGSADTDVTAMAIWALAPYYSIYSEELDAAIDRLSGLQSSDGSYSSMGQKNAESTAAVLVALCAMDIDYKTDKRFIKNGNNVVDAIKRFECADGGYSHLGDGKVNSLATLQVLQAYTCQYLYEKEGRFLFEFETYKSYKDSRPGVTEPDSTSTPTTEDKNTTAPTTEQGHDKTELPEKPDTGTAVNTEETTESTTANTPPGTEENVTADPDDDAAGAASTSDAEKPTTEAPATSEAEAASDSQPRDDDENKDDYSDTTEAAEKDSDGLTGRQLKAIMISAVIIIGIAATIILYKKKRGNKKTNIILWSAVALVSAVLLCLDVESVEEHYARTENTGEYVTYIEIYGYDDIFLGETEIYLDDGCDAFDQLKKACSLSQINFAYSGSEAVGTIYIQSINGLMEFDMGAGSGWIYSVNDVYPETACCEAVLEAGDKVVWRYTDGEDDY